MDLKELTMPGIYRSIESTLTQLKQQAKKVQNSNTEEGVINNLTAKVLKPACEIAKFKTVENLDKLKKLLSSILATRRSSSPPIPCKTEDKKGEELKPETRTKTCHLPRVQTAQHTQFPRCRPSFSSGIRYPSITHVIPHSPNGTKPHLLPPVTTACLYNNLEFGETNGNSLDLLDELTSFHDGFEANISQLQEMFTIFSQRVLVPLQTFCKHTKSRSRFKSKDEGVEMDSVNSFTQYPKDLHQCEFFVVQTMNQIKHLLWPPSVGVNEQSLSENSDQQTQPTSRLTDFERFPIVRIIPEILNRFTSVLNCASLWQKRDEIYTENAKAGLQRATRRYKKTEMIWREARQAHRQLTSELNHICNEIEANILRLETLQNDVENLKEDLSKCTDKLRTIEIKLCDDTENAENIKIQHKVLKRRCSFMNRKVETKERNFDFMNSRIRTLKADRDAIEEKIRINREFAESLQNSMIKLFQSKEAWRQRYVEKTDEKLLRKKLEVVGLRIPSPTVREKTFILKTRKQNLRDAIEIVSNRLEESSIHWSVLCCHLVWPNQFLVTLQTINKHTQQEKISSATPSPVFPNEKWDEKSPMLPLNNAASDSEFASLDKVIDFVKFSAQGSEKEQCMFMLRLWLHHSKQHASLEQLVKALQASRMSDAAAKLSKFSCS